MAHTENTNICVTDMPLRMKVINLGLLGHLIAFLMALEQRDLTSVWASRTLPCMGPQLESSGQLSPVMQRSLVHLTSTETVVMGISASEECVGERRKARLEDCVRPPRQRTSAGMEAEYQAVSGSVWIYFSHRIFYYLDFFSYFFLIFF